MKLSLRLQAIADMIPTSIVADVGSDHGKLMIDLFESGKIIHGYAIENKKGPYERLVKSLKEKHLEEYIVPLFSDGISDLPLCVETVVIAGMGGLSIIDILKSHKEKLKNVQTIIIDAHNNVKEARLEISKLGYVIAEEKMVKENNIYYEIIKFIKGEVAIYSEEDLEYGPSLRKEQSVLFKEKYQNRLNEISLILSKNIPERKKEDLIKEQNRLVSVINENQKSFS